MSTFPVERAAHLMAQPEHQKWLVEDLWLEEGVGIIGGEPKCCKSFLALQMAVSVASGRSLFKRFAVQRPGAVLLYAAEDALHMVRHRFERLAVYVGVYFESLDVQVITAPSLRLDHLSDRERLKRTVEQIKPRLLILDPFVRLHRIDENASREVAPILAYLRELQREYQLSVVVVHHSRKNGGNARAGQSLRGSSEFHAWGDSNLYLRRKGLALELSVEHRAAAMMDAMGLELVDASASIGLEICAKPPTQTLEMITPQDRVLVALKDNAHPVSIRQLRKICRIKMSTLIEVVKEMAADGRIVKNTSGLGLPVSPKSKP